MLPKDGYYPIISYLTEIGYKTAYIFLARGSFCVKLIERIEKRRIRGGICWGNLTVLLKNGWHL